jgi:hypothetical protein
LRLGDADGSAVCLGFLTAGLVAARVAEDPAGEDHGRFGVVVPVRVPAGGLSRLSASSLASASLLVAGASNSIKVQIGG